MMNSTLHKSNSSQSDTSSLHSQLKEPAQPKNVSLNSTQPKPVSSDTVPLYDTKSDLSIQPIDPEKDPANEIKTL
ncbi:hypothetical protein HUN16_12515 [Acinetobacter seifertii]|nr:hypothetical protein [Acinetobacter seifertii]